MYDDYYYYYYYKIFLAPYVAPICLLSALLLLLKMNMIRVALSH